MNTQAEKIRIYDVESQTYQLVDKIVKTDAQWKKILTPEQYRVTRKHGTEPAFCSLPANPAKGHKKGVYKCVGCGTDLFRVEEKFESGTGWPSFWQSVNEANVGYEEDNSFGMHRIEVHCARCAAHLGHVFDDGPPPTHKRYCINSVALSFVPSTVHLEKATFAGGCFWCMQPFFDRLKGVKQTVVGYTGGHTQNPTYEEVSSGTTGHAEAIEVTYDPKEVSYEQILNVYWHNIDPTAENHQFVDYGSQYRTAIFYHNEQQKQIAEESKRKLAPLLLQRGFDKPVVTEIVAASTFYPAEEYHQKYYKKNTSHYQTYHDHSGREEFFDKVWGKGGH